MRYDVAKEVQVENTINSEQRQYKVAGLRSISEHKWVSIYDAYKKLTYKNESIHWCCSNAYLTDNYHQKHYSSGKDCEKHVQQPAIATVQTLQAWQCV